MELMVRFELTTDWLQINCSTNWATSALLAVVKQETEPPQFKKGEKHNNDEVKLVLVSGLEPTSDAYKASALTDWAIPTYQAALHTTANSSQCAALSRCSHNSIKAIPFSRFKAYPIRTVTPLIYSPLVTPFRLLPIVQTVDFSEVNDASVCAILRLPYVGVISYGRTHALYV